MTPALLLDAGAARPAPAAIASSGSPDGAQEHAATASHAASAPRFRAETDGPTFPLAGAVTMALLIGLAIVLAAGRRRGGSASAVAAVLRSIGRPPRAAVSAGAEAAVLDIECTRRIDGATLLHVVRWSGRRVLVATGGPTGAVVIDREEPASPASVGR